MSAFCKSYVLTGQLEASDNGWLRLNLGPLTAHPRKRQRQMSK